MASHAYPVDILPDDIDPVGHVNNAAYIRWVQDVMEQQRERFAGPETLANRLWVALRHEINYLSPAFRDDQLHAEVLLEAVSGAQVHFRTRFVRGEHLLADVVSAWGAVDVRTHRPARLTLDILSRIRATL